MNPEPMNPAAEDDFDNTLADMLARSEKAFANYAKTLSDIEKQTIGQFTGVPAKMSTWMVYRVGLKNSPVHQAMAHMLRQQGWVDAPRCIRMVGTEFFDGEDGAIILAAPQEVYRRQKHVEEMALDKKALRAEVGKFGDLKHTFDGLGAGVSLDSVEVSTGEMSLDDAEGEAAKQAAVVRARQLRTRSR